MIKSSKPLSGVSAKTLINSAFSLNQVNRYFRFDDSDSYLRIYSKHHDRRLNEGELPLASHHLSLRYDSTSLLQRVLRTSVDVDLQNILNSYLVSCVAMTARRFTGHEVGARRGLRSGLVVDQHISHYDRGPLPVSFNEFTTGFFNFYNSSEDAMLRGSMDSFVPKDINIHRPDFSFGSYKGSDNKRSIMKAYTAIMRMHNKFTEFFDALSGVETNSNNHHYDGQFNTQSFQMRIFTISGTENSTSYRQGGSTQAINQEEPVRDKNGLYAIIRIPRPRNIELGMEARGMENRNPARTLGYDPIYSNLFNAYADCPQLGDSFIALSSCIVVKLDSFLNKSAYCYASDFSSLALNSHEQDYNTFTRGGTYRYRHSSSEEVPQYQTFGPLAHIVLPESFDSDIDDAKAMGRYGLLPSFPEYSKQEFLDLRMDVEQHWDFNYFDKKAYTANANNPLPSHAYNNQSGTLSRWFTPGSRMFNESAKQFYCWTTNGDARYSRNLGTQGDSSYADYIREQLSEQMMKASAESIAAENGSYIFGYGSNMQEPIRERSIMGAVNYNITDKRKYHDFFSFFSPHPLNQEKLYTKNPQVLLGNFPVTRNINKRGKGCIYVDQENIAYCPLSGEALKVKTYLRHSNSNTRGTQWGDMVPAGYLIS